MHNATADEVRGRSLQKFAASVLLISLVVVLFPHALKDSIAYHTVPPGWTGLTRGETRNRFKLDQKGTLWYSGKRVGGFQIQQTGKEEGVSLSPPSPDSAFVFAVAVAEDDSEPFLIRLKELTAFNLSTRLVPIQWVSWSPRGRYALTAAYYDGEMAVFRTDLGSMRTREILITVAEPDDDRMFDLDNVQWRNGNEFVLKVSVNCRFDTNSCRRYRLLVDAGSLKAIVLETSR